MDSKEQKLIDFLNLDLNEEIIDKTFEVEGRDIGEKIARHIIDRQTQLRLEKGRGFQSLDDILSVKLIGPERLELMLTAAQEGKLDQPLEILEKASQIMEQSALQCAEFAVGYAKQAESIVESAQQVLIKAENEALETRRKAIELIESAGLEDIRTAPPFVGRFLSQVKDQIFVYPIDQINIISAVRASDSVVILDYIVMPETQFYCSGVTLKTLGEDILIQFSRDHISSNGKAAIPSFPVDDDSSSFRSQVKMEVPESSRLLLSDSTSSKEIKTSSEDDSSSSSGSSSSDDSSSSSSGGSTTTPGTSAPPATTTATPACPFFLYINSNVAEGVGNPGLTAGHAWLTLHDAAGNRVASYGLWPDSHPNIRRAGLSNGKGSDVRVNYAGDKAFGTYYFCACLTAAQRKKLATEVGKNIGWTYTNTCASFASEVFEEVTGIDIDADDTLGFETPREIGESIQQANGGTATPTGPAAAGGGGGTSSSS